MAVKRIEGFDLYQSVSQLALRGWSLPSGAPAGFFSLAPGRISGKCLSCTASSATAIAFGVSPDTTFTLQQAMRFSAFPNASVSNQTIFELRRGSTVQIAVQITQTGALRVLRGSTVLATSTAFMVAGNWHSIALNTKIDATAGSFELRLDDIPIVSASATNTRNASDNLIDTISFAFSTTGTVEIDDLCLLDDVAPTRGFIGDVRVQTVSPSGDTASKTWVPSTGTDNYSLVSGVHDGDTSYVRSGTVGAVDLYEMGNLTDAPTAIVAVQTVVSARKDFAATRTMRSKLKSGTASANGGTFGLATGYIMRPDIFEVDPATNAAWTSSGVNALQAGIELVA